MVTLRHCFRLYLCSSSKIFAVLDCLSKTKAFSRILCEFVHAKYIADMQKRSFEKYFVYAPNQSVLG